MNPQEFDILQGVQKVFKKMLSLYTDYNYKVTDSLRLDVQKSRGCSRDRA